MFIPVSSKQWRRQWHPTPVLLPGKSHGWMRLVGCSPWGLWESDTTELLHFHFSLSCIGEGNGNLLQCSSLENPRGRETWWAAVYGVTQSQTRLKWLSSSSSSKQTITGQKKKKTRICGTLTVVLIWKRAFMSSLGSQFRMCVSPAIRSALPFSKF